MKRSGNDRHVGGGGKRSRLDSYEEALANGKYELRLLVTSRGAGGIIGRGGENIKRLRTEVRFLIPSLFRCLSHFDEEIPVVVDPCQFGSHRISTDPRTD
ncbi:unnamed protein product [Gongylonema pulchrum]|uniref:KH_dom_type_1 domain-containing protein n=1 Tax=Gongylonema pulchrum TaxID=637853 RepID=A0A183EE90_9BILA|nr:unnamed protein product [Gongylonema pulchrum]